MSEDRTTRGLAWVWGTSAAAHSLGVLGAVVLLSTGEAGLREDGSPDLTLSLALALLPSLFPTVGDALMAHGLWGTPAGLRRVRVGGSLHLVGDVLVVLAVSTWLWVTPLLLVLVPLALLALWTLWITRSPTG